MSRRRICLHEHHETRRAAGGEQAAEHDAVLLHQRVGEGARLLAVVQIVIEAEAIAGRGGQKRSAGTKRKKRKYSKGLKEIQQIQRSVSKASARVARAVAKGMGTYRKRSAKSALKKPDGALRDLTVNLAEGSASRCACSAASRPTWPRP